MKRNLVWSIVVLAVISGLALAACSGSAAPAPAAQPTATRAAQPAAPAAQPTAAQPAAPAAVPKAGNKTVAFVPKATESTFWLALLQGARDAAKEIGGYNEVLY